MTASPTHRIHDRPAYASTESATAAPSAEFIAVVWPTGRLIYPYTPQEIAAGVDVYTRALKAGRVTGTRQPARPRAGRRGRGRGGRR